MGFWQKLFGKRREIDHPRLGLMYFFGKSMWVRDSVPSIGCKGTPSLHIAGDAAGPLDVAVSTYERLRDDWARVEPEVASLLFEVNQDYFAESPDRALKNPAEIWATAELVSIGIDGDGVFHLTYEFDWQVPDDDHIITVYVEKWKATSVSIDG